jgi:serine/threonine protein kinase
MSTQIIGQYELHEAVGQGGMATVYKAYQPAFDRYVAIKVLSAMLVDDPTFVKRFQREAKVVARIEHRNIVPIYDYGETTGLYYIVMRLMEGGTLRRKMYYERITLHDVARMIGHVGAALDHAHHHDVIHRDLKPSNILLDESGNAYLTDFGIAKMLGSHTQITASGVVGTPAYMSPEQCQGKTLGPGSDVYGLGAILFELLTGQVPFEADTPLTVMYMHVKDPVPSARALNNKLPAAIDRVVMTALAKRPQERYASAGALARDFASVVGYDPEAAPAPKKKSIFPAFGKPAAPASPTAPPTAPPPQPQPQAAPSPEQPHTAETIPALQRAQNEEGYADPSPPQIVAPESGGMSRILQLSLSVIAGLTVLLAAAGIGLVALSGSGPAGSFVPTRPASRTPEAQVTYITATPENTLDPGTPIPPTLTLAASTSVLVVQPSPTVFIVSATPVPPSATPVPPTKTPTAALSPTPTLLAVAGAGKIVYTEGTNNSAELVIVDFNGQGRFQLTANDRYDGEPDWSPNGQQVAFETTTADGNTDIYTIAATGGNATRVTSAPEPDRHPDWSPDGKVITYESNIDDAAEIYAINADGTNMIRLTNNATGDRAPHFSPDGTRIAYMTHQRGKWEITLMSYPDGAQIALFDCPAVDCRFPAWSPNGTQIAYNTLGAQGVEAELWMLVVAIGQTYPLVTGGEDGRVAFSGDGKYMFFNRTVDGNTNLYRLNLITADLFQMLTSTLLPEYGPDWGPG